MGSKESAVKKYIVTLGDAEQYRREATRLRRDAGMKVVDATISDGLMVVAQQFDELAATIEIKQARNAASRLRH